MTQPYTPKKRKYQYTTSGRKYYTSEDGKRVYVRTTAEEKRAHLYAPVDTATRATASGLSAAVRGGTNVLSRAYQGAQVGENRRLKAERERLYQENLSTQKASAAKYSSRTGTPPATASRQDLTFSPQVERWRSLVAKYVPSNLVDKVLWTIQGESGGNEEAVGDNGVAIGLLQVQDNTRFANRPSKEELLDPEYNIKYAAEQLGMAGGNFSAWGEGSTYEGKPFGALGNNPFPGDVSPVPAGGPAEYKGFGTTEEGQTGSYTKPYTYDTLVGRKSRMAGSYEENVQKLLEEIDNAWSELDEYESSSPYLMERDLKRHIVGYAEEPAGYSEKSEYDPGGWPLDSKGQPWQADDDTGEPIPPIKLDDKATKLLRKALSAESTLSRLTKAREIGGIQSGEDAAKAYLGSEKEKSGEARRAYEDYASRLGDMSSLETAAVGRANTLSSIYRSGIKDRDETFANIQAGEIPSVYGRTTPRMPKSMTDFRPHVASIASSLPRETPRFRPIDQKAMEPYQFPTTDSGQLKIPLGQPGMSDEERLDYFSQLAGDIGF